MYLKYSTLALAMLTTSFAIHAQESNLPSYDYVSAGYHANSRGDDLSGFIIQGSKQMQSGWFIKGLYSNGDGEEIESDSYTAYFADSSPEDGAGEGQVDTYISNDYELTRWEVGAGYVFSLSNSTTVDLSASYGELKADMDIYSAFYYVVDGELIVGNVDEYEYDISGDIYALHAQVRHMVNRSFEVNAGLGFERVDYSFDYKSAVLSLGSVYNFAQGWSVSAAYRHLEDYSDYNVSIRYNF